MDIHEDDGKKEARACLSVHFLQWSNVFFGVFDSLSYSTHVLVVLFSPFAFRLRTRDILGLVVCFAMIRA